MGATFSTNGDPIGSALRHRDLALDLFERALLLALLGWLIARVLVNYAAGGSVVSLLLLPSEGLVVFLLLIRRTTARVSRRPVDWLLAFGASCAPLAVQPAVGASILPPAVAGSIMLMGIIIQLHAKLVLGRSFGAVAANRGLKFGGPYQFLRHPMYAGYLITHGAFLCVNPTLWNVLVYTLAYSLQIPRLLAEERLLGADPQYASYMQKVPYRLVPGVF